MSLSYYIQYAVSLYCTLSVHHIISNEMVYLAAQLNHLSMPHIITTPEQHVMLTHLVTTVQNFDTIKTNNTMQLAAFTKQWNDIVANISSQVIKDESLHTASIKSVAQSIEDHQKSTDDLVINVLKTYIEWVKEAVRFKDHLVQVAKLMRSQNIRLDEFKTAYPELGKLFINSSWDINGKIIEDLFPWQPLDHMISTSITKLYFVEPTYLITQSARTSIAQARSAANTLLADHKYHIGLYF